MTKSRFHAIHMFTPMGSYGDSRLLYLECIAQASTIAAHWRTIPLSGIVVSISYTLKKSWFSHLKRMWALFEQNLICFGWQQAASNWSPWSLGIFIKGFYRHFMVLLQSHATMWSVLHLIIGLLYENKVFIWFQHDNTQSFTFVNGHFLHLMRYTSS